MQRGKTGHGYVYYRTRSNGDDLTVYEHQLMMLLDNDPGDVFDDQTEVHHLSPIRDINIPWLLDLVDAGDHRARERDRLQFLATGLAENGDEVSLVTVEPDSDGIVEEMATYP